MLDDGLDIGVSGRKRSRRRSVEERAKIVAESFEPGQTVCGVARRHGIVPSQLSTWRSAARSGKRSGKSPGSALFAEVSVLPALALSSCAPHDGVEIIVGPVVVRLPIRATPKQIGDIALRLAQQG